MPSGEAPKSIRASLYIDGKPAENSIKNLQQVTAGLRRELNGLTIGTEEFNRTAARLREVQGYLNRVRSEAAGVGDAFAKVREEIEHIAEGVAIGTIISQTIRGTFEAIKAFWEGSEKAYEEATLVQTALINKLKDTQGVAGQTREALEGYQKVLQDQTGVDDDVIAKGEEVLLSYTQIRGYIYQQSIPAITSLAAAQNNGKVTMESMSAAAEQLGKALDKPTQAKKVLRAIGIDLNTQQEQEIKTLNNTNQLQKAQQIILDEVNKRYGNLAQTLAQTDVGQIQKFNTRIGNLQETLGGFISRAKAATAEALGPFLTMIENIVNVPLSEKLEDERLEMNKLIFEITDANTVGEDRAKLIDKLKSQYPEYLGYLDREKTSNQQITEAGEKLNEMYINRIILAQKDQAIEKENQRTAELKIKALQLEDDIREALVKLKEKHPDLPEFNEAASSAQKLADVLTNIRKHRDQGLSGGGVFDETFAPGKLVHEYNAYLAEVEEAQKGTGQLIKKRNELMKELNINPDFKGKKDDIPVQNVAPTSGPSAEELAAAKHAAEELQKRKDAYLQAAKALFEKIKEFNAGELADTLSKNEKEVADTKIKYDKMIAETQAFIDKSYVTKNGKKQLSDAADPKKVKEAQDDIAQLEIDKQKHVVEVIGRQRKDLNDNIKKFQEEQTGYTVTELDKQTAKINAFYDNLQKEAGLNDPVKNAAILVGRIVSLNDAELAEKKKLNDYKEKLDDDYATITDNKDVSERGRIKKKYDAERALLIKSYNDKLKDTKEFKAAMKQLNENEKAETDKLDKLEKKDYYDAAIESAQEISSAVFQISANKRNAEETAEINKQERLRNSELSNTNLTEAQKAAINEKFDKQEKAIKLKAWKAQHQADEEQAIINGALAITKTFADYGFTPVGWVAAAAQAIATIAQVAIISSQEPPEFADGGRTDSDPAGYVGQPTLFRTSASGRPFVAGEAGAEWIAPNWMVKSPRYANIIGMLEAARKEKRTYATGGYNNASAQSNQVVHTIDISPLISKLDEVKQATQDQQVLLNYDYFTKEMAKMARLETMTNAGKKS